MPDDDGFGDDLSEFVAFDDGQYTISPDAPEAVRTWIRENPTYRQSLVEFALAIRIGDHDVEEYDLADADDLAEHHYREADEAAAAGDREEARNHRTLGKLFDGAYEKYARVRLPEDGRRCSVE